MEVSWTDAQTVTLVSWLWETAGEAGISSPFSAPPLGSSMLSGGIILENLELRFSRSVKHTEVRFSRSVVPQEELEHTEVRFSFSVVPQEELELQVASSSVFSWF